MHRALVELIAHFEWDAGNRRKNEKHGVSSEEAEQVFLNSSLLIAPDIGHSTSEARHYAYGQAFDGRKLAIAFTIRKHAIRIIMARPMSRKERNWYEKEIEKNS